MQLTNNQFDAMTQQMNKELGLNIRPVAEIDAEFEEMYWNTNVFGIKRRNLHRVLFIVAPICIVSIFTLRCFNVM